MRHSVAVLTRLRQEVSEDREAMSERVAEVDDAASRVDEPPWASHAAVALHGWFFRHAYGVAFEPEKLRAEVERVRRLAPGVEGALDLLDEYLAETIDSLTSGDS